MNIQMLWIDYREKDLIAMVGERARAANLPVGDVWVVDDAHEGEELPPSGRIRVIVERKTVADLAASLNDGRYEEQSFRLGDAETPNHNIVYLLEGSVQSSRRVPAATLYGACVSLSYYKGFSLYRTAGAAESARYLAVLDDKLRRDGAKGRVPATDAPRDGAYEATVRKKKSYSAGCVAESMLCQIPGVSNVVARALLREYGSLPAIAAADLADFTYGAKPRRISKTTATNVAAAFLQTQTPADAK